MPAKGPAFLLSIAMPPSHSWQVQPFELRHLLLGGKVIHAAIIAVILGIGFFIWMAMVAYAKVKPWLFRLLPELLSPSGKDELFMRSRSVRWASGKDLVSLRLKTGMQREKEPRVVLGRQGKHLLAAEQGQSVIVVGPTQTMKTSGLAIPVLLEWEGPVVAASVKTDLLSRTIAWRTNPIPALPSGKKHVWVYDPSGSTEYPKASWSPLAFAGTWTMAKSMAHAFVEAAYLDGGGVPGEFAFWYRTAEKLIAPYLLAASLAGLSMEEVVRWIDGQEVGEVAKILELSGEKAALTAAWANWNRDDRQRSSVYTTAETVLEPFADPIVAMNSARHEIDPRLLLDGGAHTLYVCAPSSDQQRFRPLFVALIRQVLSTAFQLSFKTGRPLRPPLLVLLDEAANIAPLPELDSIASTAAGHGIQLVTIWQDMAQIAARYGGRAETVVNNHRCKIFLSGISDPTTLQYVSTLAGEELVKTTSFTVDAVGKRSRTETQTAKKLLPTHSMRTLMPGEGVLIYGHLLPARLRLRPYFTDKVLWDRASQPFA